MIYNYQPHIHNKMYIFIIFLRLNNEKIVSLENVQQLIKHIINSLLPMPCVGQLVLTASYFPYIRMLFGIY